MLLKSYRIEHFNNECMPSAMKIQCFAHLDQDVSAIICVNDGADFFPRRGTVPITQRHGNPSQILKSCFAILQIVSYCSRGSGNFCDNSRQATGFSAALPWRFRTIFICFRRFKRSDPFFIDFSCIDLLFQGIR